MSKGNNGSLIPVSVNQIEEGFEHNLACYKSHHKTAGCKITHMIGIPMIVLSVLILPFSRKKAAELQVGGWILQFIGHFVFEHNKPVLLEVQSPYTLISALVFVSEEWKRLFTKQPL